MGGAGEIAEELVEGLVETAGGAGETADGELAALLRSSEDGAGFWYGMGVKVGGGAQLGGLESWCSIRTASATSSLFRSCMRPGRSAWTET